MAGTDRVNHGFQPNVVKPGVKRPAPEYHVARDPQILAEIRVTASPQHPKRVGPDVAAAAGWRDTETLLRSYQVPDEATIRNVVLNPTLRLTKGSNSQHNSQHRRDQQKSPAA
jgi:hypothetical protein